MARTWERCCLYFVYLVQGTFLSFPRLFDSQKSGACQKIQVPVNSEKTKTDLSRKPAHIGPNLGHKMIFPKVEFGSDDLSGHEATRLLTLSAHLESTLLVGNLIGYSGRSSRSRS